MMGSVVVSCAAGVAVYCAASPSSFWPCFMRFPKDFLRALSLSVEVSNLLLFQRTGELIRRAFSATRHQDLDSHLRT
ncbi:hypothetical protein R1flu_008183 [Riccia fluitans]|uniref:Secreted protein n=1 Tax=Riccia fluitans TaxID=41844 RepID=A0ABD1YAY5_9MARC